MSTRILKVRKVLTSGSNVSLYPGRCKSYPGASFVGRYQSYRAAGGHTEFEEPYRLQGNTTEIPPPAAPKRCESKSNRAMLLHRNSGPENLRCVSFTAPLYRVENLATGHGADSVGTYKATGVVKSHFTELSCFTAMTAYALRVLRNSWLGTIPPGTQVQQNTIVHRFRVYTDAFTYPGAGRKFLLRLQGRKQLVP
eukprot:3314923-Rhodomonas_salina.4